jgi:thiol:disulfide interchange protein DsbD
MLLAVCGGVTRAQGQGNPQESIRAPHLTVTLVAEPKAVSLGTTLWMGLRFQAEPGWHIYWQNPGDSGEPPRVEWRLPVGITAGGMQWPTPKRLGTKSIVDYGYAGDTMLLTRLRVDGKFHGNATPSVGAAVSWVVCSDICIPGKGQLSVPLGVAPSAGSKAGGIRAGKDAGSQFAAPTKLFADAVGRLPRRMPGTWHAAAVDESSSFELTLVTGKRESRAVFFPSTPEQVRNASPQDVTALPNGVKLTLAKSDGLLKPIAVLRGVIVLGDGIGYEVTAPVKAMQPAENQKEKTP